MVGREETGFIWGGHASGEPLFEDTNWWAIGKAGHPELPQAEAARAGLCGAYWHPIYWYICRLGHGHEDAEDLTQAFFARLLEKNYLQAADAAKGKFRSYLLMMLKRFLADQWDRTQRQKRGGGAVTISLAGSSDTEFRRQGAPADELTPDKIFDHAWAESLVQHALQDLEQELAATGKANLFIELKSWITCDSEVSCAATAEKLGLSVSNVKVTVHRLRLRFRELLRQEIARTARTPAEVEEEMRDLFAALS